MCSGMAQDSKDLIHLCPSEDQGNQEDTKHIIPISINQGKHRRHSQQRDQVVRSQQLLVHWTIMDTKPFKELPNPGEPIDETKEVFIKEVLKTEHDQALVGITETEPPFGLEASEFSQLMRLLRVTAWCQRFADKVRKKRNHRGPIVDQEARICKAYVGRLRSRSGLPRTQNCIREDRKHPLRFQLGTKISEDGLIRCHGRLAHADLDEKAKFLIRLPPETAYTKLVIQHCHQNQQHAGVNQTLANIPTQLLDTKRKAGYQGGT